MEEADAYTPQIASVKHQCVFEKGSVFGKSVFGSHGGSVGPLDTAGSRTKPVTFDDDDALVREVEKVEESLRSGCSTGFDTDKVFTEGIVATDSDEDVPADFGDELSVEFDDVRPMDYDTEFCCPLIDDLYGGSNAAEVITTTLDDNRPGGSRPSTVFCSLNDDFDHFVVSNHDVPGSSGHSGMDRKPIKNMNHSWSQPPTTIHNGNPGGRHNVDSLVNPKCDATDHDMPHHVTRMVLFPPHGKGSWSGKEKKNSIHRRSACTGPTSLYLMLKVRKKLFLCFDLQLLYKNTKHGARLPPSVLTKVASCLAKEGVEALTNLLVCSPAGVAAVLHPETLHVVRLDKCRCFPWWADPISWWYHFYQKCLRAKNPYALYVDCLRLAFNVGEIQAPLYILNDIKDIYPMAKLTFIILSSCAGQDCEQVYQDI
ncbi:unnamed protein product [Arabis nemorensis]|uniref:Uncharacterized protein n=1 Tax=Arabis nemorensis TaxID=586526 RepID=A0A565B9M5_9BRAS|nr:unnamed protein product [Arabis nemorensis]